MGGFLVSCRRQLVEVNGAAQPARPDAVGVLGEAQPGDRKGRPKGPVLLVLVSRSHTQAVFGVIAIVFDITHRPVLPSVRYSYNDQRLQGCYSASGTYVEILLWHDRGKNTVRSRRVGR